MGYKAGEEILAYCSKCKMDLLATIVAMKGEKPAKVMCKTCKAPRGFVNPKGISEPGATPTKTVRKRATKAKSEETVTVAVHVEWNNQMSQLSGAPRVTYSTTSRFKEKDVLKHPTFGEGVVQKLVYPNKCQVLFENDIKTLIHSAT